MSKITQGCIVQLIDADFKENIGATGTVLNYHEKISYDIGTACWKVKFSRPVKGFTNSGFIFNNDPMVCCEYELRLISPPPSEMTPNPVEAPVEEVPA